MLLFTTSPLGGTVHSLVSFRCWWLQGLMIQGTVVTGADLHGCRGDWRAWTQVGKLWEILGKIIRVAGFSTYLTPTYDSFFFFFPLGKQLELIAKSLVHCS